MPRYQITTPEQVRFHHEIAGLASRAMAWVVDQIILWVLRIALFVGLQYAGLLTSSGVAVAMALVAVFFLDFGYYIIFELYRAGQSPGKRVFRIRVISAGGGRLRFPEVFIRNLLRPVDTLPYCMLVGGVVAWIDPYRRRLGDLASDTIVVRDAQLTMPEAMLRQQARANSFQEDPAIRGRILARATREERDLLLDLMLRRDELEETRREELFEEAAKHFRKRYGLPDDLEYLSDEQTVLNLALVIQRVGIGG